MNRKEPSSNSSFYMTAKTMHGLEDILVKELKEIGAEKINKNKRAVTFYGNKELLYKSNLCLRTALRILKPISIFKSNNEHDLYKKIQQINWEDHMSLTDTFLIDTTINYSKKFTHSQYVSQKIKDAIVDQFRKKYGRRPSINKYTPKIKINLHKVLVINSYMMLKYDTVGRFYNFFIVACSLNFKP